MTKVTDGLEALAPDFVAGLAVGKTMEAVALEGFSHQVLAHRNMRMVAPLETTSRHALAICGLSSNRFALYHRRHHAERDVPPQGLIGTIDHVMRSGTGNAENMSLEDDRLTFPGYSVANDPLLRETNEGLEFRSDPPLERLVGRGGFYRLLPLGAAIATTALFNKLAGRKAPTTRAIVFTGGMMLGLTSQSIATAVAEGQAGMSAGKLDPDKVPPPLRRRLAGHQAHHDDPGNLEAGIRKRHEVTFKVLHKLRLLRPVA